jgi:hypothetical protein
MKNESARNIPQTIREPKKTGNFLIYILSGVLILFIFLSGYLIYARTEVQKEIISLNEQVERLREQVDLLEKDISLAVLPATKESELTDWETYTNKEFGFEIKHPSNVILEERNFGYFGSDVKEIINFSFDNNQYLLEDSYGESYLSIQKENIGLEQCQKTYCCGYTSWKATGLEEIGLSETKELNNNTFYRHVVGDTDMQASYGYIKYNTFYLNSCYRIVLIQKWSSTPYKSDIVNDKELIKTIEKNREILKKEIPELFSKIFSTFKFID